MFTRQNDRPKASPGAGQSERSRADGKLWQKEEEKAGEKAGEKLSRKKGRPNVLHVDALSIK